MAILRRTAARPPAADHAGTIRQGRLSLDLEGWHAHWAGAEVPLTVTEFSILRQGSEESRVGIVCDRPCRSGWQRYHQKNTHTTTTSVDQSIHHPTLTNDN